MNLSITVSRTKKDTLSYRKYSVAHHIGMTVLDALLHIHTHLDPTLAFRWECRQGICGTCGVMYNGKPILSCSTQIDTRDKKHILAPLSNFPVEKDLIVDIAPVLKRYMKIKPYLEKIHDVMLTKTDADRSKPFRKCIECGCCIAGSPTVSKNKNIHLDPMALVKIARYVTDPRDGGNRRALIDMREVAKYSTSETNELTNICPRGIPIDEAVRILKQL